MTWVSRQLFIGLVSIGLASGCSVQQREPVSLTPHTAAEAVDEIEAEPASALVFSTPLPFTSIGEFDIPRDERQPSAFVGFDGPITTEMFQYIDDRQGNWGRGGNGDRGGRGRGGGDQYLRETEMVRTGVSVR